MGLLYGFPNVYNCNIAFYFLWYLLLHANQVVAQPLITLPDFSRQGYMFWSDVTANTTSRAKLDGSEVTILVNTGLSSVGKVVMNENMCNGCIRKYK